MRAGAPALQASRVRLGAVRRQAEGRRRVLAGGTGRDLTAPLRLSPFKLWASGPELALQPPFHQLPGLVPQGQSQNAALLAALQLCPQGEGVIRKSRDAPKVKTAVPLAGSPPHPAVITPREGARRQDADLCGGQSGPGGQELGRHLVPTFCTCCPPRHNLGLNTFLELPSWPPLCASHGVGNALVLVGLPRDLSSPDT